MQLPEPRIPHRAGWLGHTLSKQGVSVELGPGQQAALDELMQRNRAAGIAWPALHREHFSHPALDGLLRDGRQGIDHRPGRVPGQIGYEVIGKSAGAISR